MRVDPGGQPWFVRTDAHQLVGERVDDALGRVAYRSGGHRGRVGVGPAGGLLRRRADPREVVELHGRAEVHSYLGTVHGRPTQPAEHAARRAPREDDVRAPLRDGYDGHTGGDRQPRQAGLAALRPHAGVERDAALRVGQDDRSAVERRAHGGQRIENRPLLPVDWEVTERAQRRAEHRRSKQSAFGQQPWREAHASACGDQHNRIERADVVGRQHNGTATKLVRHVARHSQPAHRRDDHQRRTHGDPPRSRRLPAGGSGHGRLGDGRLRPHPRT